MATHGSDEPGSRLYLPSDSPQTWAHVEEVLSRGVERLTDLDAMLTSFSALDREPRRCTFFADIPGSSEAGCFDFELFLAKGAPLLLELALAMPQLFEGVALPIHKTNANWPVDGVPAVHTRSIALTRRQCACLLAHSVLGSLKRPEGVQPNDFRFTACELFIGTACSPNSAITLLNYFSVLGRDGFADGVVTFGRQGYANPRLGGGGAPWAWEASEAPLCAVHIRDGNLEESAADVHAEFANAFVGGGVVTGDFAMEEILFLVKPELMVAMALQNRMADTEVICVSGAVQYSRVQGFGADFEFAGDYTCVAASSGVREGPPPKVVAIDAVRGGGPAMTEAALRRDLDKARIAFDGARELATGHWGCGAFGNNHDLMFLKQWLAASDAGVRALHYFDFQRGRQSHSVVPLARKLRHLSVARAWAFLRDELTAGLGPADAATFSTRVREVATGKRPVPPA